MQKKPNKSLVLLSGGQDSTTCLAIALNESDQVEAICFDYGQRHQIELEQAKKVAELAHVPLTILDLKIISQLTKNALTQNDLKIEPQKDGLPNTFVPGRNHLFLSFSAIYAYQKKIHTIYTGVCQTDFSGYPDCREEFIKSLNQSLNLAMNYEFQIKTPLMWKTKAESVRIMVDLGKLDWLNKTHTCYEGKRPACGICPACELRLKGFKEAGINDPLEYE